MFLAVKLMLNGYKIAYQPETVVYHSHNYPLSILFKRYFDIGVFLAGIEILLNSRMQEKVVSNI